jgi:hypothetical protein
VFKVEEKREESLSLLTDWSLEEHLLPEPTTLEAGLRIRIHFIRIRIQHFRMNTNPDPDPIRIQGFNDQKLEKITAEKIFFH